MLLKYLVTVILCLSFLSACATPEVVSVRQVGDRNLSCSELEEAIAEADRFEEEARDEREVTGKNVAAAVFFWPALVGTAMNTGEAIEAAEERRENLLEIYDDKGC